MSNKETMVNIGYGNFVQKSRIIAIISPDSAPIKRLIQTNRDTQRVLDATFGRKTRSVIVVDNQQLVLSALQPETLVLRISGQKDLEEDIDE